MALFDTDAAYSRTGNLWRRLGGLYERAAYAAMEKGYHDTAIDCARKAEVCFWQATGEGDSLSFKDLTLAVQS